MPATVERAISWALDRVGLRSLMRRSIKTLRSRYVDELTEDDVRAAALQHVRKVSGFRSPAQHNAGRAFPLGASHGVAVKPAPSRRPQMAGEPLSQPRTDNSAPWRQGWGRMQRVPPVGAARPSAPRSARRHGVSHCAGRSARPTFRAVWLRPSPVRERRCFPTPRLRVTLIRKSLSYLSCSESRC